MPTVELKSPAFMTHSEAMQLPNGKRYFHLFKLKMNGAIGDAIKMVRPLAYYPLTVSLNLKPGQYVLFGGKKCKFFHVSSETIYEIPNPRSAQRSQSYE